MPYRAISVFISTPANWPGDGSLSLKHLASRFVRAPSALLVHDGFYLIKIEDEGRNPWIDAAAGQSTGQHLAPWKPILRQARRLLQQEPARGFSEKACTHLGVVGQRRG